MIRIVPEKDFKKMPWKNGKGETTQLFIHPEGSSVENNDFSFRLSSAPVMNSGEFSNFSGKQRILFPIQGSGFFLNKKKFENFEIATFSGEEKVYCELINGPILDFGIIYDPKKCQVECEIYLSSEETEKASFVSQQCSLIFVGLAHSHSFNALYNGGYFSLMIKVSEV